jgi:hypothetical protein
MRIVTATLLLVGLVGCRSANVVESSTTRCPAPDQGRIAGTLLDRSGAPAAGVKVGVIAEGSDAGDQVVTDAQGRFDFGCVTGGFSYNLNVGNDVFVRTVRVNRGRDIEVSLNLPQK